MNVLAAFLVAGGIALSGWQLQLPRQPDAVYAPTPQNVVDAMLRLARVTSADVVYDLGSGDGRIPISAARDYGARGVGIDIDPLRIREANDNLSRAGIRALVHFVQQDLFQANITEATVVTLYLGTRVNEQLIPKLKAELRPGTRIVSHQFTMGDRWPPERSQEINGLMIYLWTTR
jgi:cyclopropane fatty-acyl-phospholipid synthase-like methyltransferase